MLTFFYIDNMEIKCYPQKKQMIKYKKVQILLYQTAYRIKGHMGKLKQSTLSALQYMNL